MKSPFRSFPKSMSPRNRRVVTLASAISELMRDHPDREEALDASNLARLFFKGDVPLFPPTSSPDS